MPLHVRLLASLAALGFAGCAPTGFIYTETVRPLDTDLQETEFSDQTRKEDVRTLQYWFVRVKWKGNGIGEIAKAKGFTRVYYADLETLSVLLVWTQHWVRIYGEREAP